jgi:hypothetical protein
MGQEAAKIYPKRIMEDICGAKIGNNEENLIRSQNELLGH